MAEEPESPVPQRSPIVMVAVPMPYTEMTESAKEAFALHVFQVIKRGVSADQKA
jgi:hypothetical protein